MSHTLGEHFFRREYGRVVAMLSRQFGLRHFGLVEDSVQHALLAAVESWTRGPLPENPSAWLFRVARNHVVGELRRHSRRQRLLAARKPVVAEPAEDAPSAFLEGDVRDDLLRMLFVCCDDAIPVESQLVLALKTLCGFDVHEIAERLFLTEANVYKRLGRARARLQALPCGPGDLTTRDLTARVPAVRSILYVLFTEGHFSSHPDALIRRELCNEAMRLAHVLAEHPVGAEPETFALLSLMHLHAARMTARQNGGRALLLEEQERELWDQGEIQEGFRWLAESARGDVLSRFHAEAGIAAEHCLAASLAATRWDRVVDCYATLERLAPSPLHAVGRALAVAEWRGPAAGLEILEALDPPAWLAGSYMWLGALADLHGRCGDERAARRFGEQALQATPSPAIEAALARRLRRNVAVPRRATEGPVKRE